MLLRRYLVARARLRFMAPCSTSRVRHQGKGHREESMAENTGCEGGANAGWNIPTKYLPAIESC